MTARLSVVAPLAMTPVKTSVATTTTTSKLTPIAKPKISLVSPTKIETKPTEATKYTALPSVPTPGGAGILPPTSSEAQQKWNSAQQTLRATGVLDAQNTSLVNIYKYLYFSYDPQVLLDYGIKQADIDAARAFVKKNMMVVLPGESQPDQWVDREWYGRLTETQEQVLRRSSTWQEFNDWMTATGGSVSSPAAFYSLLAQGKSPAEAANIVGSPVASTTIAAPYIRSDNTLNASQIASDVTTGKTTIQQLVEPLGVSEASLSTLVILETKYKTGEGYNLVEAMQNPDVSKSEKEMVELFGKEAIEDAKAQAAVMKKVGDRTLEEAIIAGALDPQDLVTLGLKNESGEIFTQAEAKKYISVTQTMSKLEDYKLEDGSYDLARIESDIFTKKLKDVHSGQLTEAGFDEQAVKDAIAAQGKYQVKALAKEYRPGILKAQSISRTYLDWTLPVYGTQRHWSKMAGWQRGLSIAADALFFVGIVRGVSIGARASASLTKLGRLSDAARGGIAEGIAQVAWPADVVGAVRHPVASAQAMKNSAKESLSGIENFIRPGKLPASVVISGMHSAKLPAKMVGGGQEAMALRDALMALDVQGINKMAVGIEGGVLELNLVPLMKKTGGVAHGSVAIEEFDRGMVVKWIPSKPAKEQGLFFAPNPIGRYGLGESAHGAAKADKTGFYIFGGRTKSSGKLYAGTAEMEHIVGVGGELPAPAQKLFTRINGQRVEIYLTTKLSKADILELKAAGLLEQFKTLYTPTLELKGAGVSGLTKKQVDELSGILYKTDPRVARNLREVYKYTRSPEALRAFQVSRTRGKAYLETMRLRVKDSRARLSRSRTEVVPRRGELLDDAIRRVQSERRDALASRGYDIVQRPPSAGNRAEATGRTVETPRRVAAERGTVDVSRVPPPPRRPQPTDRVQGGGRTTPAKQRLLARFPDRPESDEKHEQLRIPPGASGWKQGAVYWHIWPEGNELKKRATREPVPGIPYKTGLGSAYASLRKTYGEKLPKMMAMDMGIMDVYIQGDQRGDRPQMKVRQDLQRRTKLDRVEGQPSMSKMKQ